MLLVVLSAFFVLLASQVSEAKSKYQVLLHDMPKPIQCLHFNGNSFKNTTCNSQRMGPKWGIPTCMSIYHCGKARQDGYHCGVVDDISLETCLPKCPETVTDSRLTSTCCCTTSNCQKLEVKEDEYYEDEE